MKRRIKEVLLLKMLQKQPEKGVIADKACNREQLPPQTIIIQTRRQFDSK